MVADPRISLARPDLADAQLEGLVRAERFEVVRRQQCGVLVAPIRKSAGEDAEQQDQLLFGEGFDVLEETGDWAWGQARRDGYVGWVRTQALAAPTTPTHWVRALRTIGFSRPDLKSAPVGMVSMNALVTAAAQTNGFVAAGEAGWIFKAHLSRIGEVATDPAAVAERYLGAPYLWGGRDSLGLDCSGLIQQALYACGRGCPRDTDQQMAAFGQTQFGDLRRGDLVFWRGHAAMMLDRERIIHANAHHMAVAIEPLAGAIERIRAAGVGNPTGFRRP